MFSVTVLPGLEEPEDKPSVTPCAKQVVAKVTARMELSKNRARNKFRSGQVFGSRIVRPKD
jgi:hypothetical protein